MVSTYYTSLSGMTAASYGIQNTSNNVANMQTPGFKRTDVFYSSLGNGESDLLGSGVQIGGTQTNFSDGKFLGTGNSTDLAMVGNGFFIIKLKNEFVYTRDGEFGFNKEGILIDKRSGGIVQGYDDGSNLVSIHQQGPKTAEGKATRMLFLKGQFILPEKSEEEQKEPGPFKNKYQNIKFDVTSVYDNQGKSHTLHIEFKSTPILANGYETDKGASWDLVNVTCEDAEVKLTPSEQQIIFANLNTAANPENSSIKLTLNNSQPITINFGTYQDGSDEGIQLKESKLNPEGTKVEVIQNDGYGVGKPLSLSFSENGQIIYHYDNGQTIDGIYVGLARFENLEHDLIPIQDSLFKAHDECSVYLGRANKDGFGSIAALQIESSNVDSTMEFANIVVLQRMFQACSQIMNIDKQLLEELVSKS